MVLAYVSAIQDISLSPVLMSGAGTSMPGPGQHKGGEGGRGLTNLCRTADDCTSQTVDLCVNVLQEKQGQAAVEMRAPSPVPLCHAYVPPPI